MSPLPEQGAHGLREGGGCGKEKADRTGRERIVMRTEVS